MPNYHIVIAEERRTPTETPLGLDSSRVAQAVSQSVSTGKTVQGPLGDVPEFIAGPEQLHHMGALPEMLDNPQFVMVAEWDLQAPYVTVHKGDYSKRNLHFGGWPVMAKEQFDALPAAAPAA